MTDDEMMNSILAAGWLWAACTNQPGVTRCDPVAVNGVVTNVLEIKVNMLSSPYRVTVEIVPEEILDTSGDRPPSTR